MTNRLEGRRNPEPGEDFEKPPRVQVEKDADCDAVDPLFSRTELSMCRTRGVNRRSPPTGARCLLALCTNDCPSDAGRAHNLFQSQSFLAVRHGSDCEAT